MDHMICVLFSCLPSPLFFNKMKTKRFPGWDPYLLFFGVLHWPFPDWDPLPFSFLGGFGLTFSRLGPLSLYFYGGLGLTFSRLGPLARGAKGPGLVSTSPQRSIRSKGRSTSTIFIFLLFTWISSTPSNIFIFDEIKVFSLISFAHFTRPFAKLCYYTLHPCSGILLASLRCKYKIY